MATLPNRYLEDLTGTSPNNKVIGDVYPLSDKASRAVAMRYGPFFGDTMVVYDDINNTPLVRNKDYSLVGLLPELTARTGKGVYDAVLITKPNMGNRVRLDCQVVGGPYHNQSDTIATLAEAVLNDKRPVEWHTGVLDKPYQYPTAIHPHWLQDVVGFGPLVASIDRVATAITMGQGPIFNFLLGRINGGAATNDETADGILEDKYISPATLKHALTHMNFNAMYLTPYVRQQKYGTEVEFSLTTNIPQAFDDMFWSIEHHGSEVSDFISTEGQFKMLDGAGKFIVKLGDNKKLLEPRGYRVTVRRDKNTGPVMISSYVIDILEKATKFSFNRMNKLYSSCCLYDVDSKDPISMFFADK